MYLDYYTPEELEQILVGLGWPATAKTNGHVALGDNAYYSGTAEEYRDDAAARVKLTTGIEALANTARQMARQDAQEIVQRFGQLGARRFNLAA